MLIIIISFVLWWDGMTPLTPITKIISMEPVEKGTIPIWPKNVWVKGKVIRLTMVGFTIDDGTGTIRISKDRPVGIGQYVVVRGIISITVSNNKYCPILHSSDIHIVLFFHTEIHLLITILLVVSCGVCTSIYWYWKNNSK